MDVWVVSQSDDPWLVCKLYLQASQGEFDDYVDMARKYAMERGYTVLVTDVVFTIVAFADGSMSKRVQLPPRGETRR